MCYTNIEKCSFIDTCLKMSFFQLYIHSAHDCMCNYYVRLWAERQRKIYGYKILSARGGSGDAA